MKKTRNPFLRGMFIAAGTLFSALGIVGIFIPLLPTTPFLLLAAACFVRSSERMYNWLMTNRLLGDYLRNYVEGKGIPLGVKAITIAVLWGTILISMLFFTDILLVRLLLLAVALGVSAHLLFIRTRR